MKTKLAFLITIYLGLLTVLCRPPAADGALPSLDLVKSGTTNTHSESIAFGTGTYSLDLRVNTGGNAVSGLQYYFATLPASALVFSITPLTVLNLPFTNSDLFGAPASGATVNQAGGTTAWFKASAGDYPAIIGDAIGRYTLNTSSLSPGTYVVTPVGEELTNAGATVTTFASPGSFSLTVSVPEPNVAAFIAVGLVMSLLARRRLPAGDQHS